MAYKIISTCTACDACRPVCPIDAISAGDPIYVIDQEICCDFEDCLAACPVNAIVLAGEDEDSVNHTAETAGRAEQA